MELLGSAKRLHHAFVEPLSGPAVGASPAEINALEDLAGIKFPAAYREFLLWMGCDYDGIFQGSDCFVKHINSNNASLPKLLEENGISPPATPVVTFFSHQGYTYLWFHPEASSQDPTVFSFGEDYEPPEIKAIGPFSQWLLSELEALAGVGAS